MHVGDSEGEAGGRKHGSARVYAFVFAGGSAIPAVTSGSGVTAHTGAQWANMPAQMFTDMSEATTRNQTPEGRLWL